MNRDPRGGQPARHTVGRGVRRRPGGSPQTSLEGYYYGAGQSRRQRASTQSSYARLCPTLSSCELHNSRVPRCLDLWLLTHKDGPHWLDKNLLPTYLPCLALGPPCKHPVEARMNPGHPQLPAVVPSSSYAGCLGALTVSKTARLSLWTALQAHFSLHQAPPHIRAVSPNLPSSARLAVHVLCGFGKLHLLSVAVSLSVKW